MKNYFDITDFGAVGDGKTDSTKAIQDAIDAAKDVHGCVVVPTGTYLCGYIRLYSNMHLMGSHGWGYRENGGSILKLNDPDAKCLLDITGAYGCMVEGIHFDGNNHFGNNVHGIMVDWPQFGYNTEDGREDCPVIRDVCVNWFSGDGIHLDHIFAFNLSDSFSNMNKGNGLYMNGWDGVITNCSFGGNFEAGIGTDKIEKVFCAMTVTASRFEWNRKGGIVSAMFDDSTITGNWFDRNGGPAIDVGHHHARNISISGNTFRRNGRPRTEPTPESERPFDSPYENSHIFIRNAKNVTITGNTFSIGQDDNQVGVFSPDYSVIYDNCRGLCLTGNAMFEGCIKENIVDCGKQKSENIVIANNCM